jgi:2-amino-4-hydroxy-6-hydroxymethyldihydropteridine diphosphokinase
MSGVDSTDVAARATPVEKAAASGELPEWAVAGPGRRAHMERVADLLEQWADALGLDGDEVTRWRAVGFLHDALRDADPVSLVAEVNPADLDLPPRVLHGPAAARRLQGDVSPRLLMAIRYHTIGHPDLDDLGRALYLADFLEPGRSLLEDWRADLRSRMPHDRDAVLLEVLASRIRHLLDRRAPLRRETADFWTRVALENAP